MKKLVLWLATVSLCSLPVFAQAPEQGQGQEQGRGQERGQGFARVPGEMVVGKVTAVSEDSVTIAPAKGGDPVIVKVGNGARIFKERQPIKISEIKVDDTVMARGQLTGNTLQAGMLGVVNPEMLQRMQEGQGMGMGMGTGAGAFKPEDLGKRVIFGEVKAMNETRITIARPDNQSQDIEVDENTSFRKGRESVTLADIKVGDFVRGPGELKDGIFVPKELIVGRPGMIRPAGNSSDQSRPDSEKPATTPRN